MYTKYFPLTTSVLATRKYTEENLDLICELIYKNRSELLPFIKSLIDNTPIHKRLDVCFKKLRLLGEKGKRAEFGAAGLAEAPLALLNDLEKL